MHGNFLTASWLLQLFRCSEILKNKHITLETLPKLTNINVQKYYIEEIYKKQLNADVGTYNIVFISSFSSLPSHTPPRGSSCTSCLNAAGAPLL